MIREYILQEKKVLSKVLLSAYKVMPNGCNFRLIRVPSGSYYIEYGCNFNINSLKGDEKLLYNWILEEKANLGFRKLSGIVSSRIIKKLEKLQCHVCGGTRFYKSKIHLIKHHL